MATPESLLVGIACILAQSNSLEAAKVRESLTPDQVQLVEQLQQEGVCEKLEQYLEENKCHPESDILINCHTCLKTTTMTKKDDGNT
jgi:hypothetical protein